MTTQTTASKTSKLVTRMSARMSKSDDRMSKIANKLTAELERFFQSELDELRAMKVKNVIDTGLWVLCPPEQKIGEGEFVSLRAECKAEHQNPLQLRAFTNELNVRVEGLTRKLQGIAWKFSYYGLDIDDTFQTLVCELLERSVKEPEFASQEDAYICQYAKWCAWHLLQSSNTYSDYVSAEKWTMSEDGEEVSQFEFIPTTDPEPEVRAEMYESARMLAEIVATLSPENRVVVKMLYVGYSRAEIAKKLNISRPAVTQRLTTVKKALRPALAAYVA